jgi:predicted anti-sigma-YlaC factor YlaD
MNAAVRIAWRGTAMILRPIFLALVAASLAGCSLKRIAVDAVGDSLADSGGVYASDGDPDLVREALPFGLKTIEGLLAEAPDHGGLLLAAARGFAGYAYLLQQEADVVEAGDFERARGLRARASKLFLRGRDYGLRGLELAHPGFRQAVAQDSAAALAGTARDDAAFLYWSGVAWAGALAADPGNLELLAELPIAAALVKRVLALDAAFDGGAADEFFIAYEGGRPGGDLRAARRHYERAVTLSGGRRASVHLALAESVAVQEQDAAAFRRLIAAALAVDPDGVPDFRLVNTMARRRAQWLEAHAAEIFLEAAPTE